MVRAGRVHLASDDRRLSSHLLGRTWLLTPQQAAATAAAESYAGLGGGLPVAKVMAPMRCDQVWGRNTGMVNHGAPFSAGLQPKVNF